MGHIKDRDLKDGTTRFYAEVKLKGFPRLTATFSRKTDAKRWIQKTGMVQKLTFLGNKREWWNPPNFEVDRGLLTT